MIPTIGRTVIVLGIESNGATEQCAVITRSWGGLRDTRDGPIAVNLTVFLDAAKPEPRTSVMLFEDRAWAESHRAGNPHALCAFWPTHAPGA